MRPPLGATNEGRERSKPGKASRGARRNPGDRLDSLARRALPWDSCTPIGVVRSADLGRDADVALPRATGIRMAGPQEHVAAPFPRREREQGPQADVGGTRNWPWCREPRGQERIPALSGSTISEVRGALVVRRCRTCVHLTAAFPGAERLRIRHAAPGLGSGPGSHPVARSTKPGRRSRPPRRSPLRRGGLHVEATRPDSRGGTSCTATARCPEYSSGSFAECC
jgi:hypothetical protein